METLFTKEEFESAQPSELLKLKCKQCNMVFLRKKTYIQSSIKRKTTQCQFCSKKCCSLYRQTKIKKTCENCGTTVERRQREVKQSKTGKFFCTQSCAATYNNHIKPKRVKKEKEQKQPKPKTEAMCKSCGVLLTPTNTHKKTKTLYYKLCKKCRIQKECQDWIKLKNQVIQKMGGKCQDCGGVFSYQIYDFHHLDPHKKQYSWTKLKTFGDKRRDEELKNCVLLCGNCHALRHIKEFQEKNEKFHCLINDSYKESKKRKNNAKTCKYCGIEISDKNTNKNSSTNKNRTICKSCVIKRTAVRVKQYKQKLLELFGGCCSCCKTVFPIELYHFHHVDSHKKIKTWTQLRTQGYKTILKEMNKCIPLCINCHRKIHIEEKK